MEARGKGFWIERLPNGEKVICFKIRSRGKTHIVKLTLAQLREILDTG
jgi:hypothetical protein